MALWSQLIEAKAALEDDRTIQPPNALEVLPSPEPKISAAGATIVYNPSAAVADLTPPAGTPVSPEDVDPGGSRVAASRVPAEAGRGSATERFTIPLEIPLPPLVPTGGEVAASKVSQQRADVVQAVSSSEVRTGTKPSRRRLLALGVLIALSVVGAGVYWHVTHTSTEEIVSLSIQTSPSGATVHAGAESCIAPCTLKLKRGKHEITADLTGYISTQRAIDLQKDQSESLPLSDVQPAVSAEMHPAEKPSESTSETPVAPPPPTKRSSGKRNTRGSHRYRRRYGTN